MAGYQKIKGAPEGFHTVTPYLSVNGGMKAVEFYKKAFAAKEIEEMRNLAPDGKVIHARIKIGDSLVMLSDNFGPSPETQRSRVTLHIYTDDVDALWHSAVSAGAKIEMPLADMFWGERYGQLIDPFGHRWSVSTRINMNPEEMEAERKKAMTRFNTGENQ